MNILGGLSRPLTWGVEQHTSKFCSQEKQLLARSSNQFDIYLEVGTRRTFAGAIEWPGWCRSGPDEQSALQALFEYGPRYVRALHPVRLGFQAPTEGSAFAVIERLKGNAATDFGAPNIAPASDTKPISEAELRRFQKLMKACWRTFDTTARAATGKALRKGPRGGGRDLEGIIQHVLDGDASYLAQVGWKLKKDVETDLRQQLAQTRQAILDALVSAAHGEMPARGPRGGVRWTPRYFVRRVTWHILDHAWEIEDRVL